MVICRISEQKKFLLSRWSNFPPAGHFKLILWIIRSCSSFRWLLLAGLPLYEDHDRQGDGQGNHNRIDSCPWWYEQGDLTEDCLADTQGFCFGCVEERCPEEPDDCTGDYAQNDPERT
jgi:hypothetical protein